MTKASLRMPVSGRPRIQGRSTGKAARAASACCSMPSIPVMSLVSPTRNASQAVRLRCLVGGFNVGEGFLKEGFNGASRLESKRRFWQETEVLAAISGNELEVGIDRLWLGYNSMPG